MPKKTQMTEQIYNYLKTVIPQQGYAPSVREICEAVGLKSPSTVHFHLKRLQEQGLIEKGDFKGRAIVLVDAQEKNRIPILGNVAAGAPILAQECIEDYLTFDCGGQEADYFALRVRGESMLGAGILPDDLVVVHQQPLARSSPPPAGRSWWLCWGTRPRSSVSPTGTAECGCCRRTTPSSPSTAATPWCWAR